MQKRLTHLIIAFLFYNVASFAQVTIGTDEQPEVGALLQLKNINGVTDASANSTKGLGLPKVKLTTIDNLKDLNPSLNPQNHVGLILYNSNIFCHNDKMYYPGLYVWDGENWGSLNQDAGQDYVQVQGDIWVTKDQDGNPFRANKFGNQIWMIDNLAAKSYASESGSKVTLPSAPNGTTSQQKDNVSFGYPAPNPAPNPLPPGATGAINGTDSYYYDNFKEYGLLYTWMAATAGTSSIFKVGDPRPTVDQQNKDLTVSGPNEVEQKEAKGYIQGICPNGWHLPSDKEWHILTNEFLTSPEKYSYITQEERNLWDTKVWNNLSSIHPLEHIKYLWASSQGSSGLVTYPNTGPNARESNVALAMKRPCDLAFANPSAIRPGRGFLAAEGGFNMIPAGSIYDRTVNYGIMAKYWTSSMGYLSDRLAEIRAFSRVIDFNDVGNLDPGVSERRRAIVKELANTFDYCSIRCVYHGTFQEGMPESWRNSF